MDGWLDQCHVVDNAYLVTCKDDLSVNYLKELGLINKMVSIACLKVMIWARNIKIRKLLLVTIFEWHLVMQVDVHSKVCVVNSHVLFC